MTGRDLDGVVDAAHRVAGTIGARSRGDVEGARTLLASFDSHEELSGGSLLVAELALGLLAEVTQRSMGECVGDLNLRLMATAARRTG